MAAFANLGVTQKLGILFAVGVLSAGAAGGAGLWSQSALIDQAELVRNLEAAAATLNHLDTREAELKVDAYRSLAEPDVTDILNDLPDDVASVTETLAALDALTLPDDIRADIEA